MQVETFSKYQAWVEAELEVAKGVRKRKWLLFWKVTGIYLAACAVILLLFFAVSRGEDPYMLGMAAAWAVMLFLFLTVITFLCMLPGFFKGKYARKIKRSIKQQGFDDARREQFAREQLLARRDPAKSASVVITQGQDRMPAQFTLGEHFACFTGGTSFGPYILNVDDTEVFFVRTSTMTLPVMTRVFSFIITKNQSVTTYMIHFVGHGREQGRFTFGDPAVCETVLNILRQRFPEAAGR